MLGWVPAKTLMDPFSLDDTLHPHVDVIGTWAMDHHVGRLGCRVARVVWAPVACRSYVASPPGPALSLAGPALFKVFQHVCDLV